MHAPIRYLLATLDEAEPGQRVDDADDQTGADAERFGQGALFDHGTVSLGDGLTVALPPPRATWFEAPLGAVAGDQFAIDLRTVAPRPVRRWLHGPIETRGLPDGGPESSMRGGSLAQWFDVIVHRQTVTPTGDITTPAMPDRSPARRARR